MPSTMGLRVAESHRLEFGCAFPKHASLSGFLPLPLPWA